VHGRRHHVPTTGMLESRVAGHGGAPVGVTPDETDPRVILHLEWSGTRVIHDDALEVLERLSENRRQGLSE
jgi:hypothetical protein